ncbi:MAG: SDR family oxidoreductase [Anaerolineae bacterium]|nr:SDR family oxidoreductase [Anaerolineae bacterium]
MLGLEDKVVLVTGGNHGIGAAIVEVLEDFGAKVAYNYRSEPGPRGSLAVKVDVTDEAGMAEFAERTERELGPIYGVVPNAGIIKDNLIIKMPAEDWHAVLEVNLTGAYYTIKPVLPKMYERQEGSIVFISSLGGQRGNIGQANYSAAKAGMIALAQTLALEAARYGVRSNVVAPGYTETDIVKGIPEKVQEVLIKQIPMRRFAQPKEMAWVVAFLLSPIASSYITGQVIPVNGGQYF